MSCHAGPPGDQTAGAGRPTGETGGSFPLLQALTCTAADGNHAKYKFFSLRLVPKILWAVSVPLNFRTHAWSIKCS